MSMKPILFNTDMVRAILDGRKTVTRRVVKPQHLRVLDSPYHKEHPDVPDKALLAKLCEPPYSPGDILWVRETWAKSADWYDDLVSGYEYKADHPNSDGWGWRPSIHMPREAARIFLRVTDVRVERLQEMHAEDSLREGVKLHLGGIVNGDSPLKPFGDLWDSTIKPADRERYGWAANPWVWVIAFERCKKPKENT